MSEKNLNKRFVLSNQEFAQKRLSVIREVFNEIKKEYPEVLSLCMFGSMVNNGTNVREDSDIDGYLFIDVDLIKGKNGYLKFDEVVEVKKGDSWAEEFFYLKREIAEKYILKMRKNLKEKLNLDENHLKHLRTMPISEEIVDRSIENMSKSLVLWVKKYGKKDGFISGVNTNLFAMFHLSLDRDIRKYRKYLLNKLSDLGADGDLFWKEIINSTEQLEQKFQQETGKRYPKTLADARKIYG